MLVFLLSSLFLPLIGNVFALPEECNPIECFRLLDTLFHRSNLDIDWAACEKLTKIESCIQLCTENITDNFFLKGLADVKEGTCDLFKRVLNLEDECGNTNKFHLSSIIYDRFNLEVKDPNANKNSMMCRRAFEEELSDVDYLNCSIQQSYLSTMLIQLYEPMKRETCFGLNYDYIVNLEIKSMALMKDIYSLADCLDANSPYLSDCIPKKSISTNMQQKNNLCSDVQSFFNCVEGVVENNCNSTQTAFFSTIRQPVFSYLLPHCPGKQEPLKSTITSNKLLNEVYTDSSSASVPIPSQNKSEIVGVQGLNKVYSDPSTTTFSTPNISEFVVVHQHIVITMTSKDKNAANQICVSFYLIVLSIMFGMNKVI